ncbi:LysR family transcriptional regulator [Hyphomicrobium sp. MC1]|uniref:LysR family transcriptional regulator n=1 Tax=Hyphomicrobium sp. (strain MC1) TaxID=717785 RepID=UPI000213F73A|nr:LysR substrate-binding domain-containing protein [Hyphomicrobium sp. MC1]CCB68040.1 Transcriptional regulator, LysR family [Hyphomicrobium sp. MC1]
MDLRQLEHFVAAADEQHFTRAARKVNIVQSGLSASIRALEQEMGAPLFVRTTRKVELTVAGRVLYEKAQEIIAGIKEARRAVAAINGLERGTLSVGTCGSLHAFFDLPQLLGEFHAQHPSVEIKLCHGTATKLMESVKDGSVDIGFFPLYEKSREIVTIPIASDHLVVVHPMGHPIAGRENVPLESLAEETFVDFQPDKGTRKIVDRAFASTNVSRRSVLEVGDIQVLLDLVAYGFGIALVPKTFACARIAAAKSPKLGVVTLKKPHIAWDLVAACSGRAGAAQTRNPAVAAFTKLVEKIRSDAIAA